MRIRIERRGGFAGLPAVGERDESELSTEEHGALGGLLASPPRATPAPGADRFHYKIRIEDDNGTRELDIPEDLMPESLAAIPKIKL